MTTLAAPSVNEGQNTLASTFTRGTDTTIVLTDGTIFPNAAHVIRIANTANTKWCLVIYTTKATNTLTMGGGATDYAVAKNVTTGDEAYEWPIGSTVELVCAADEIAQLFTRDGAAIHDDTAGEIVAITEKTAPIANDEAVIEDSADSNNKKSLKLGNLPKVEWARLPSDSYARAIIGKYQATTKEDKTLYVRTDGNDNNDGSVNDSGNALLTIQKAVDIVSVLIIAHDITISVEDGTYSEMVSIGPLTICGGSLTLQGDVGTPGNCIVDGGSARANGFSTTSAIVTLKGFKVQNCTAHGIRFEGKDTHLTLENIVSTSNASGVFGSGGHIEVEPTAPVCVFGDNTNYGFEFQWQATAYIDSAEIDGNGTIGILCSYGSYTYARLCTCDAANKNGTYGITASKHAKAVVYRAAANPLTGTTGDYTPIAEPGWGAGGADMAQVDEFMAA